LCWPDAALAAWYGAESVRETMGKRLKNVLRQTFKTLYQTPAS